MRGGRGLRWRGGAAAHGRPARPPGVSYARSLHHRSIPSFRSSRTAGPSPVPTCSPCTRTGRASRAGPDERGRTTLDLHPRHLPLTVFVAVDGFAAHLEPAWIPDERALHVGLTARPGGGSRIAARATFGESDRRNGRGSDDDHRPRRGSAPHGGARRGGRVGSGRVGREASAAGSRCRSSGWLAGAALLDYGPHWALR